MAGRPLATCALVAALLVALTAPAAARPCSDTVPVVVRGVQWIVFTGDSRAERRRIPCAQARRMAKRMLLRRQGTPGWRCNARLQRCVRGGTVPDGHGGRRWRYLVGWHLAD